MSDEQTPQSDLIDDAIRQAERQLEAKLEALRMSALGDPTPLATPPSDDVAILRPTGGPTRAPSEDDVRPADASADAAGSFDVPDEVPFAWQDADAEGEDASFAPLDPSATFSPSDLYVPDSDGPTELEPTADDVHPPSAWLEPEAEAPRTGDAPGVTSLTAMWEEEAPAPAPRASRDSVGADWDRPEPVHAAWTEPAASQTRPAAPAPQAARSDATPNMPHIPSEDEMQFWAHTRTALRNLQQVTDSITGQVTRDVSILVEQAVSDAIAPTEGGMRAIHTQLQQGLPKLADRFEGAVEQALVGPTNGIRQIRDELPTQLERVARDQRASFRDDLDATAGAIHGAVQADVAHLEQSIAANVTRMAATMTDTATRVERDVDVLGESVVRFERGMHNEFDRVESQLRAAIDRVESSVRDEFVEPTETVRKLDEELPARFGRIERTLLEQLQNTQRDLSSVLTSLVDASRASIDRIGSLASTLDDERARRVDDVETIVDTVTTGWEGLAGAMKALFQQAEDNSRRLAAMEQRLGQIRDLEEAVERSMTGFADHVANLQPAPIVVSVSHPEATVENTTRGGWVPDTSS
ncbi:MAG: hypothetical protein JWM86_171 [Thermoleophilia bacterium]|nr:hypothetical protein [Thermoleophilia bacterium]